MLYPTGLHTATTLTVSEIPPIITYYYLCVAHNVPSSLMLSTEVHLFIGTTSNHLIYTSINT